MLILLSLLLFFQKDIGCNSYMSESGVDKKEISTVLQEVAVLSELKGENFLQVKAYFNAAKSVQILEEDPEEMTRQGRLKDLKDMKGNRCHISPTHHGIGQHRKAQTS